MHLLVISSVDHLTLRIDNTVDDGECALCWSLDQETKCLEQIHKGAPYMSCDFSVDCPWVH